MCGANVDQISYISNSKLYLIIREWKNATNLAFIVAKGKLREEELWSGAHASLHWEVQQSRR